MIRHKTMLIFKAILVVTVLCLITPSEADDSCLFCDENGKNYLNIIFPKFMTLPMFSSDMPTLKKMASDMEKIEKDMKIDGLTKDKAMKGAMAYSLCSMTSDDLKNAIILKLLELGFRAVNKDPDQVFLKDCKAMAEQQKYSSDSEQPKNQTQSDEVPKSSQNADSPSQYNLPPGNLMPAASPKDQTNSSKGNNQNIPVQPNNQNKYKYDDISQQQYSASGGSAYSGQEKIIWDQPSYNSGPALRRNPYQQPTTNQGYASVAAAKASASSFSSSSFNGPWPPNQQPPAQKKTSADNYNPQQNYQGNPNAFPNTKRDAFFNKVNNPYNTPKPDEWNNRENSQLYGDDLNNFQKSKLPNPFNTYNSPYSLSWYPDNQNVLSNFQTGAATSAYSNTRQQSNYFNNGPYFKPSPDVTPSNNHGNSYNKASSFAVASSSFNNAGSDAEPVSSFYPKDNSPNQQYPSPYTIQSNPNPNYLITAKKPERDTNLQNVPSTKDAKTSKAADFSETLYGILCYASSVKNVMNEKTTKSQLKPILNYVLFYAMYKCGYPQDMGQKCADDSGKFADGLPEGLPTSIQVKAICEMMKMQFISTNMIGDNPVAQAQCLGNYMKDGFEKLQKSPALPDSQQDNQEIAGVPNKKIDNNNKEYIDDNPTLYNKSTEIKQNKENDQPNFDTDRKNYDYKGPFTTLQPQAKKIYPYDLLPGYNDGLDYNFDDDPDDDPDDNADTAEQTTTNPQTVIQNQPGNQQSAPTYSSQNQPIENDQWGTNQPINQNSYPISGPQSELMKPNSFPQQKNDSQDSNLPPKQPNPDAIKNTPAVNSIAESKDRVDILKKITIACLNNGNFNYKNYSKGVAMVANMTKMQHPEMPVEDAKTLTLVDAVFAALYIIQGVQKANPDAIKQLQMTDMSLQLPQNINKTPNYPSKQSAIPNPDYQTGQTSKNPQPMTQDKPVNQPDTSLLPPVSPSQDKDIQNKQWETNQPTNKNPYSTNKLQKEPIYWNSASAWASGNQPWQNASPINKYFADTPQLAQPKNLDNPIQSAIKPPVPMQSNTYPDSATQIKQGPNDYRQNPYFTNQNQMKPSYMNPAPQPNFPGAAQNKQLDMFNSNQAQQIVQNKVFQPGMSNKQIFPPQPMQQQYAPPLRASSFQNSPGSQQQPSGNSPVHQQSFMIPPNGINLQNNGGYQQQTMPYNTNNLPIMRVDQHRLQEDRMNVPNGIQNRNPFDTRYPSTVNMQSVGQSGNQGANNPQAMRFDVPPNNPRNWNSPSGINPAGNQGFGGINPAGNQGFGGINPAGNQGFGGINPAGNYPRK